MSQSMARSAAGGGTRERWTPYDWDSPTNHGGTWALGGASERCSAASVRATRRRSSGDPGPVDSDSEPELHVLPGWCHGAIGPVGPAGPAVGKRRSIGEAGPDVERGPMIVSACHREADRVAGFQVGEPEPAAHPVVPLVGRFPVQIDPSDVAQCEHPECARQHEEVPSQTGTEFGAAENRRVAGVPLSAKPANR